MREWGRAVQVEIAGAGVLLGEWLRVADYDSSRPDQSRGLNVNFIIRRHSALEPQPSTVTIWGLSEQTRDAISRAVFEAREQAYLTSQQARTGVVRVRAGRPGAPLLELAADVLTDVPLHERDGADWRTTIQAADGRLPWAYGKVAETRSETVDPLEVARQQQIALGVNAAANGGATLAEYAPDLAARGFTGFAGGLTMLGAFVDQNQAVLNALGLTARFSRGQLVWYRADTAEIRPAVELVEGQTLLHLDPPAAYGFRRARAMLNPLLEVGRQIFLQVASGARLGPYRVDEVTYTGGTRDIAWYADLTLRPTSL